MASSALAAWAWLLVAGKDLSWDVLNHHVYLPYALTSGRFASDLLAAGLQSTQHPIGYLPFWGLLGLSLPAWAVGGLLALVHASLVLPLLRIARALWPASMPGSGWWCLLALLLALLAPCLLLVVGTSSTDPLTAALVLWALALSVPGRRTPRDAIVAGALLGLAIVVKPTNVVFALALHAAWASRPTPWRSFVALLATTGGIALLLQAPWSWWLWREFDSPLFPLFNQIFHSPYGPQDAVLSSRYMPQGLADWFSRPFLLAQPMRMTHTEALAPDLRPALCALVLAAAAVAALLARMRGRVFAHRTASQANAAPDRELLVFTLVAYALWMLSSGNSRYALPLFVVIGIVSVRATQCALPAAAARVVLGLAVVLQGAYYFELGSRRFDTPVAWSSGPYVDVRIPDRLRNEPALHLVLGTPSFAVLAPWLHRDGAFINAIGTMSLPTEGPLGDKLRIRLQQWEGRTRILLKGRPPLADNERAELARASHDRSIQRFGLQVDWRDCLELFIATPTANASAPTAVSAAPNARQAQVPAIALSSCAARARPADNGEYARELAFADRVFSVLESQCPHVFGPRPMVTDANLGSWHRQYLNSDARVSVSPAEGVILSHFSTYRSVSLGAMTAVSMGQGMDACAAWKALIAP